MKYLIVLLILFTTTEISAQIKKPTAISVSYFGETITHPGLKIGLDYELKSWDRNKKKSTQKIISKSIILSSNIGFYFHKDYQTGAFALPELSYSRKNQKGNFRSIGLGVGYMRTFIPNVYEVNTANEIKRTIAGNNYFLSTCFVAFGKDLSVKYSIPMGVYIKPQIMYALPNYPNGVTYFALEIGINYKLICNN